AGLAMMVFIWIALTYVIVAFADLTAASFVVGSEELRGVDLAFHPGGAVAAASVLYLLLAVTMGLLQRFARPPLWLLTLVFVPATFGIAWLGTKLSGWLQFEQQTWALLILGYCCVASLAPLWALLQPRGYLGGFVLYAALILGVIGMLFGGYEIVQPAFKTWNAGGLTGSLFPFLFVTIACGACSGFHGLVCSGTTSRQVESERHIQPLGYGAMLAEGFVAVISLVTVMIVAPAALEGLAPGTIYGNGIGRFLTLLIGAEHLPFAITFGAMAFATFVFDTLDVSMRLGRYLLQELAGWRGRGGAVAATLATAAIPAALVGLGDEGGWVRFWTLFGASNQLLAALTLLAISVWLARRGKPVALTLVPMTFVLAMTLWALGSLAVGGLAAARGIDVQLLNALAAAALIALALFLVARALLALRRPGPAPEGPL
ncbi:MAG: carbon starvation CstA family protein, partial [Thermoanaerobaculia bacterium]